MCNCRKLCRFCRAAKLVGELPAMSSVSNRLRALKGLRLKSPQLLMRNTRNWSSVATHCTDFVVNWSQPAKDSVCNCLNLGNSHWVEVKRKKDPDLATFFLSFLVSENFEKRARTVSPHSFSPFGIELDDFENFFFQKQF